MYGAAVGGLLVLLAAAAADGPLRPWVFDALDRLGGHRALGCAGRPEQLSPRCAEDIAFTCGQFAGGAEWAVRMYDAMTKNADGVLEGHLVHLGNFDECVGVRDVRSGGGDRNDTFDGQHCIVGVRPRPGAAADNATSVWDALAGGRWLEVAWCVPSSCSPEDVLRLAEAAVAERAGKGGRPMDARASAELCSTGASGALRPADIAAICILSLMTLLLVLSTAYDIVTRHSERRRGPREEGLLAFSALSNGRRLLATRRGRDLLGCLHGLRFLSAGWVLLANCALLFGAAPADNAFYAEQYVRAFVRMGIVNGDLAADTFFLLSGLLVSYLFLKDAEVKGGFNVLRFYAHRYLRLTPPAAAVVLLTASLLGRAGSGPLWTSRMQPLRERCERGWWRTLLYVSNYWPDTDRCVDQSWFLAADAQLYLLSPLVLLPLRRWPRPGRLWVALLLLAAWAAPFALAYWQRLDPAAALAEGWAGEQYRRYHYLPTYTRSAPWLVGVLLGAVLRRARRNKPRLGPNVVIAGWSQTAVVMLVTIYAQYPFQQPDRGYDRVGTAFYLSLFRLGWSVGVAWVIFACDQGYGGFVNAFLSWDAFQPLGRLSYCLYLTHVAVIHVMAGSVRSAAHLSDLYHISQFFATFVMSIAWAIPLTFLFELPVVPLEKALFGLKCRRQSAEVGAEGAVVGAQSEAGAGAVESADWGEEKPGENGEASGRGDSLAPEEAVELGALPTEHGEKPTAAAVPNGAGVSAKEPDIAIKIDQVEYSEIKDHAHLDVEKSASESQPRNFAEKAPEIIVSGEAIVKPEPERTEL